MKSMAEAQGATTTTATALPRARAGESEGPTETEVSALCRHSGGLVQWSPDGAIVAVALANRLVLRARGTLQILQQYTTVDAIQGLAWSEDSTLVLTAMYRRGVVQVWSAADASWTCRIQEGLAGLIGARWAPDARHVLTVSDFQLQATVWSLVDSTKSTIRHPKLGAEGLAFSPDQRLLAVAERHDCKDHLGLYSTETWELVTHFALESYDCVELAWSPDNCTIAVRDSHLEYRVLLYASNGTLLSKYQAYENALGLKSMGWSLTGQFLALGSYDDHLRILSYLNWKPVAEFDHETIAVAVNRLNKTAVEYEEHYADEPIRDRPQGKRITISERKPGVQSKSASAASSAAEAAGGRRSRDVCFVVREPPFSVITISSDPLKDDPKSGLSRVLWNHDASFLATKSDQMPHNVWVWEMETMQLYTLLSFIHPVRALRWDPTFCRLAICTGSNRVYLWSLDGISWIDIPAGDFKVLGLRWNPSGNSLVAVGKQEFCCLAL